MASACVGDYIEVRDEAMTELLADGYGPVVTSNDLGICSALLSSYFALTREVKYVSLRYSYLSSGEKVHRKCSS